MKLHPLHSVDMILSHMNCTGEYFDKERCTGRSERLALGYIHQAIGNPHTWIIIKDHYNSTSAHERLAYRCRSIITALGYKHFTCQRNRICFGDPPSA